MPTRNFRQLVEAMPPARQQKIETRFQESLASMPLEELRKAREMTELQLGEVLGIHHSEVSKIEHRADICVSTLVEYVEALGGHLEIRAIFPDREVRVSPFEHAGDQ
jgi:DNA-binding Xre family transcriptional regulator